MKGILDIEFILSVMVFLGVTAFAVFMIAVNIMPSIHRFSVTEEMRSRTYQMSEVLMSSQGSPVDWNETNVNSLGLSSQEFYILDPTKIDNLKKLCDSNYDRARELLGYDYTTDISINITYNDGTSSSLCGQKSRTRLRPEYTINRVAVINRTGVLSIVRLSVGLIK